MSHEFRNASAAFKKLNPHLFGVGGLQASKPKPVNGVKSKLANWKAAREAWHTALRSYCTCVNLTTTTMLSPLASKSGTRLLSPSELMTAILASSSRQPD